MNAGLDQSLSHIDHRIRSAALAAGRAPDSVRLVAVTKTVGAERVGQAISAGACIIGESYIQEAQEKFDALQS
ncbi:YggS family pyridoxal phosphate-dependent enzyme, partial [Desulfosarcina sp. OttesenSCG-928-B08]|nr:YggS family pyridoxal phosphate-dependent enzyme [Desulfosarcina sp. OttesenSCG-928-B08]